MFSQTKKQICLIVCIGIPASGKTTFCIKLKQAWGKTYNVLHVNYDELCNGNFSFKKRKEIVESVSGMVVSVPYEGKHLILIDDNMYYKSMRSEYVRLAKQYEISFLQLYFDIDLEIALERNKLRKNPVPEEIIKDMAKKLEIPEKDYYTLHKNFDATSAAIYNLKNRIDMCLDVPMIDVQEKVAVAETLTHKIDLMLRKIVSGKIKYDQCRAAEYVQKRKEIFSRIKNKDLEIAEDLNEDDIHSLLLKFFTI